MFKKTVLTLLLLISLPLLESQAGLFFRQGRGLFPNAIGVAGRMQSRQQMRQNRACARQSGYSQARYTQGFRSCSNCNKTRANATFVSS